MEGGHSRRRERNANQARFLDMKGFDAPAASPYAATTPELLRWFKSYNEQQKPGVRIFPFGFLLSLQVQVAPPNGQGRA